MLVVDYLLLGWNLYLLSIGIGLVLFMSIIKDLEVYEYYDKIILIYGVCYKKDLVYEKFINEELLGNEFFGDQVWEKLIYYFIVI